MTKRTSCLTRFLALALALIMVFGNAEMGLRAFAAEGGETTTLADLLSWNELSGSYMTPEEIALLSSDSMVNPVYPVAAKPSQEDLTIVVDAENKKITEAKAADDSWVPYWATVINTETGEVVEEIAICDGDYDYAYEGDDFRIQVDFVQYVEVPVEEQAKLANAPHNIAFGINALQLGFGADSQLGQIAKVIPALIDSINATVEEYGKNPYSEETNKIINDLNSKLAGGDFELVVANKAAQAKPITTLLQNAEDNAHYNLIKATVEELSVLNTALKSEEQQPAEVVELCGVLDEAIENLNKAVAYEHWNTISNVPFAETVSDDDVMGKYLGIRNLRSYNPTNTKLFYAQVSKTWINVSNEQEVKLTATLNYLLNGLPASKSVHGVIYVDKDNVEAEAKAEAEKQLAAVIPEWEAIVDMTHFERGEDTFDGVEYVTTYNPVNYKVTDYDGTKEVPYGTVLDLPAYGGDKLAYSYTVNGKAYREGSQITVEGDTTITRTVGNAFITRDTYTEIANLYANDVAKAILKSGALVGSKEIHVRVPDKTLLYLDGTALTAENFEGAEGMVWAPAFYITNNDVTGQITGNAATIEPAPASANVVYRLNLGKAGVAETLKLAETLKAEADKQVDALQTLMGVYADLGDMNYDMIDMIGVIVAGADFTKGDGTKEDAKNIELVNHFTGVVNQLFECLDEDQQYLRLYNLLTEYNKQGLVYYYQNYEQFQKEVDQLSVCADGLVGDPDKEAALRDLLARLKYEHYIDKISKLDTTLASVKSGLIDRNDAIDMESEKLAALLKALRAEGAATAPETAGDLYIESAPLDVTNTGYVAVTIHVFKDNELIDSESYAVLAGGTISQEEIDALIVKAEKIFNDTKLYVKTVDGDLKPGVVGQDINVAYFFTPRDFTVTIVDEDGKTVGTDTVNVHDVIVNLPQHEGYPLYTYEYYMGEELLLIGDNDFGAPAEYTIVRKETEKGKEESDRIEKELNAVFDHEKKTFTATIEGSAGGFVDFATTMKTEGFSYISINGEPLLENNQFSLQTLVNAILSDPEFSSDRLIALNKLEGDASAVLLTAENSNLRGTVNFDGYTFILKVTNPDANMVKLANGLESIKPYMTFKSSGRPMARNANGGAYMDVYLTLPQTVYEVYLTALLATSELDKTNMEAINNQIAFDFLYDYINTIMVESDATAQSFQNTIDMLVKEAHDLTDLNIPSINVAQYSSYYNGAKKLLQRSTIESNPDECTITVVSKDKDVQNILNMLIDVVGVDDTLLSLIKEYNQGGSVTVTTKGQLTNVEKTYEAALIDTAIRGIGKMAAAKKVYDFTDNLAKRAESMGAGYVTLLRDVDKTVTFNSATILDLNGYQLAGLNAKGKVIVVDTNPGAEGGIGSVTGNVTLLDGTYTQDVTAFLKDGYVWENNKVDNAVYKLDGGNIVVNTNFMFDENIDGYLPAVHYMAIDLALDMALNFYPCAALNIDGYDIYSVNFDDLVGIVGSDSNKDKIEVLVDDLLACFRFDGLDGSEFGGIDGFINAVIEDMLDLEGIAKALRTSGKVAEYKFTTNAWSVALAHVDDRDHADNGGYITVGIVPSDITKSATFALTFDTADNGPKTEKILKVIDEMARVITDETYMTVEIGQPERKGKELLVSGSANGYLSLDFSHNDNYIRLLAYLLSFGDPEAFEGIVKEGNVIALEEAIDQTTAGEVFNALKVVAEKTYNKVDNKYDFDRIADWIENKLDQRLTDAQMTKLENLFDTFMNGVNKVLAKIDASAYAKVPMSKLKIAPGTYELTGDLRMPRNGDVFYRGYGVDVTIEQSFAGIKIKLYSDCLWGDANHDGEVNAKDATLIARYGIGLPIEGYFCTLRTDVNGDCVIDDNGNIHDEGINAKDATLVLRRGIDLIDKFPVEE